MMFLTWNDRESFFEAAESVPGTSFAICISSKSLWEFQYWWITYSHIMKRDPTSNVMTETEIGRL
ncbi:hypothetical protein ABKV19_001122 [Rosa sericea]